MFFELGTDEFTRVSKVAFEEARKEVAAWAEAEVVVTGHTDSMGTLDFNDILAKKRAQMVASRLVAAGVPADRIAVAARGERELLIKTAEDVAEPRNRRVEIKVR
jgi:outer membrane protein OmpA-like peptidoglycan-associated protein